MTIPELGLMRRAQVIALSAALGLWGVQTMAADGLTTIQSQRPRRCTECASQSRDDATLVTRRYLAAASDERASDSQ
jgi:hypothetical protein